MEAPRFVTHSRLSGNVPTLEALSFANNHTMDYSAKGFLSTLEALEKANIMAGAIFLKKWTGLMFAINLTVNE